MKKVYCVISIHTLTLRVTRKHDIENKLHCISIHTLTLRVTLGGNGTMKKLYISIHTLTLRVTTQRQLPDTRRWDFNPHPHTEGDSIRPISRTSHTTFQSTPSH